MNIKNALFLGLAFASSYVNVVYASQEFSAPVSVDYLRHTLYYIKTDQILFSKLCASGAQSCTERPDRRDIWSQTLSATNVLSMLGFSEAEARAANALLYIRLVVPNTGTHSNGPRLSFHGGPADSYVVCRLHASSGSPILPTLSDGSTTNAFKTTMNASPAPYSEGPLYATEAGMPPGETYHLLCVVYRPSNLDAHIVAVPLDASSVQPDDNWEP